MAPDSPVGWMLACHGALRAGYFRQSLCSQQTGNGVLEQFRECRAYFCGECQMSDASWACRLQFLDPQAMKRGERGWTAPGQYLLGPHKRHWSLWILGWRQQNTTA